ncbi:MAG: lysoplasmalogenase [Candidatus Heimdallarchaeota archaeon]|nr:lysoplasmalogenase [Candidatus Heimdallarchaeota archaeon]
MGVPQIVLLSIFCSIVFLHLLGEFLYDRGFENVKIIRYLTKPFLIPLLLSFYILTTTLLNWWIVIALVGGFLGDVFLMVPDPKEKKLWLRFGLISFLLGHIFYVVAFILIANDFSHYQWWSVFLIIPFVIGAIIVHPRLTKHTGDMTMAVTAYIIIIALMGISTTFLLGFGTTTGFVLLYVGSWFFVISDIINGIGKFVIQFKYERVITMFTYILGQLLLVLGIIHL